MSLAMRHEPTQHNGEKGSSLIETLIALLILAMAMVSIFGAMATFTASNTRNQTRTYAAIAARTRMEELRFVDPATLPVTGTQTSASSTGQHQFTIITQYCPTSSYCNDNTRHVVVRVEDNGNQVFETETVFTQLR